MPSGRNQGEDLTGRKFGRLTVVGLSGRKTGSHTAWECRCDCGNAAFTDGYKLTTGQKKSCGCLRAEARQSRLIAGDAQRLRLRIEANARLDSVTEGICCIVGCGDPERSVGFCAHHYDQWNRLGHPLAGTLLVRRSLYSTTKSKEIKAYSSMKSRCGNPKSDAYENYGARGIRVCDRWLASFDNFLADMGRAPPGTSLERLDFNGNYEPGNCVWGTSTQQARNTRATKLTAEVVLNAKRRLAKGDKIVDIARDIGVKYGTIYQALNGKSWNDIEVSGRG